MNFFQRTLPSLDALVFFEASARHLNFTRAAAELNVSQVAVSKRIRELELRLDIKLFDRLGRKLALTEQGQALNAKITPGLSFLEDAISATRARSASARQVVTIAANENVNFFWLAPLMRDYQLSGKDTVVSVVTANNVTDVIDQKTDLAIFHGRSAPKGWQVHHSFPERLLPVAGASYCERDEVTLLDYTKESPDWVNWTSLIEDQGPHWFDRFKVQHCTSYIQSITLAAAGHGVAIGVLPLLQHEFERGVLQPLRSEILTSDRHYFVATPDRRVPSTGTMEIAAFLGQVNM
jgi:DNA-binding transcriptional LysR family regulator